ncbi:isoflavone reductase family protein-like protein CipA [Aaosphaeria arxii CBS 175.79]|uniref:Isoflavone reductase family protein-like protein CipA n=1 Tax=Aaosphaeria arxii CBS 175.79 TaxID=1450172 RepID=A0A6A5XHS0_9PLEO|nr:isoflavone reductase family protein-like protein CipA [Aaosphaeria arxii CBS 175.79]KAF2012407.1 isoflavone reductase family protein-like protein CipA [Aaosphaeria arxii CBS 175.79]
MSKVIKNVALAGATGSLGSIVLASLVNDSEFNVTVIARKDGQSVPKGVSIKIVDTDSVDAITEALRGQDALIDATSGPDSTLGMRFIDAAAAAGVYRVIPGEFSADVQSAEARSPLVFHGKNMAFEHLKKLSAEGKITYTTISNAAFLDWNLRTGFINIDIHNKKVQYLNDGTDVFPWTHLSSVGTAVVNALAKPQETENRACYISNIRKSQKQMVDLAKDSLGADGWDESTIDAEKALKAAAESMLSGTINMQVIGDMIRWSCTVYSPRWEQQDDNKLLGVRNLTDDEVMKLIKEIAAEKK